MGSPLGSTRWSLLLLLLLLLPEHVKEVKLCIGTAGEQKEQEV